MKLMKCVPGVALSVAVALLACWLESLLPIHMIGSVVIAMFIGVSLNGCLKNADLIASGRQFTSKKILEFAIIPAVITFAVIQLRLKQKEARSNSQNGMDMKADFGITTICPWFILETSIMASVCPIPALEVFGAKTVVNFRWSVHRRSSV